MTVGEAIVAALVANGIDRVFCVPGESYLGLLDALHGCQQIDTVVARHESGAGFMALADARLTNRAGVALVSRGPGASNAAIAVHTAQQDGVPFILIVGQVAAADVRRDAFQEIDYRQMFGSIAKWTIELTRPDRTAETMLRAIQVAHAGTPGPVVIAVPEDVLTSACPDVPAGMYSLVTAAPDAASILRMRRLIGEAKLPLVIAGSGITGEDGRSQLLRTLEAWNIPAVVSFRRQDLIPNAHPLYAGDMGLANPASQMAVLRDADLIVVLGARLSDITTQGYTFPRLVRSEQTLVHVHADPDVLGTHFSCDLAIGAPVHAVLEALGTPAERPPARTNWIERLQTERRKIVALSDRQVSDGIPFERVVHAVGRALPPDAIVTVDAGTFGAPVYRVIPFAPPQRLLAPISGAMGFGVPAAVAAALRAPERPVICFVGDGGFAMTGSELSVAVERRLPLKVFVSENGIYASIRIHQEREYPGRTTGTSLTNPDLELIGRAYGATVTRLATLNDLERISALIAAPGLQFVVVTSSLQAILPRT